MTLTERIEATGLAVMQFGLFAIPLVILVWGFVSPSSVPDEEGLKQAVERAGKIFLGAAVAFAAAWLKIKDLWHGQELRAELDLRYMDLQIARLETQAPETSAAEPWIDREVDINGVDETSTNG